MLNCDVCNGLAVGGSYVEVIEPVEGLGLVHETYFMCLPCKEKYAQTDKND